MRLIKHAWWVLLLFSLLFAVCTLLLLTLVLPMLLLRLLESLQAWLLQNADQPHLLMVLC